MSDPFSKASSAGREVLVIGNYPPVPTAGAAITLEVVRRLWAEGAHPHVAAPRASAAPVTVAVTGVVAGRRLTALRLATKTQDVVVCAERDLPVPTGGYPLHLLPIVQRIAVNRLVQALAQFDHVTLIACGDLGVPAELWARLVFAADVVVCHRDALGTPGVTTLGGRDPAWLYLLRLALRGLESRTPRIVGKARRGLQFARRGRLQLGSLRR